MNLSVEARTGIYFVRGARLSEEDLRLFEKPRGWRAIVTTPGLRYGDENWWRSAVIDADECGRGLLAWCGESKRWSLSEKGRAALGLAQKESTS